MKTTEYLSKDIFEENYLKLFRPFRAIQMVLGSCRVDAKDRFVTSPTNLQKLYTLICIFICAGFYASIVVTFMSKYWPYQNIYFLNIANLVIHFIQFTCNIVHVRFINNDENVKFYIKTQEIDRNLKINNNKFINDVIYNANLMTVVVLIAILLILYAAGVFYDFIVFLCFFGVFYSQLCCTLEWLYCANILIFFYLRLRFMNAIITNHIEGTEDIQIKDTEKLKYPSMKVLRYIASNTHDFVYSETDIYLKDIFEEFFRFQNLYRMQVLLFCFKFVTCTLVIFEYSLLSLQNDILIWLEYMVLPTLIAVDLLIVIVICVRCELFAREIKHTKYLCTTVLSLYYGGPLRQKAMRMLKMIIEKPPRFSVYDMWYMDAATMIHMINLVTTLMVALLQFALV